MGKCTLAGYKFFPRIQGASVRPHDEVEQTGRTATLPQGAQIDPAILAQHDSFITRKAFNQRAPRFGLLEVNVGLFFETVLHESTPAQAF